MRMSFDDEESFKEVVGSLHFNNPSSDTNAEQQMGSSSSMTLDDTERNDSENNIIPSDPITLWRVGSSSSLSIQEIRRSADILNSPPSNPEFVGTSG